MGDAIDLEKDLVQMPFVAGPRTPFTESIRIQVTELIAPAVDSFIADPHAASRHHLFDILEAQAEPKVQPHAMQDDLLPEPVTAVRVDRHPFSIPSVPEFSTSQCH